MLQPSFYQISCKSYSFDAHITLSYHQYDHNFSNIVANVQPVGEGENAQTLWGDLPDPKPALEENGFQMRHVVLTPRRRR